MIRFLRDGIEYLVVDVVVKEVSWHGRLYCEIVRMALSLAKDCIDNSVVSLYQSHLLLLIAVLAIHNSILLPIIHHSRNFNSDQLGRLSSSGCLAGCCNVAD